MSEAKMMTVDELMDESRLSLREIEPVLLREIIHTVTAWNRRSDASGLLLECPERCPLDEPITMPKPKVVRRYKLVPVNDDEETK